jgi:hypothetical protein
MQLSRFNLSWVGLDSHFSWRIHDRSFGLSFTISVYRVPRFLQCILLGQVHREKFPISVMDRCRSFRMRNQRVIASPKPLHQLMDFQFDFYAFVKFLNHIVLLPSLLNRGSSFSALANCADCRTDPARNLHPASRFSRLVVFS